MTRIVIQSTDILVISDLHLPNELGDSQLLQRWVALYVRNFTFVVTSMHIQHEIPRLLAEYRTLGLLNIERQERVYSTPSTLDCRRSVLGR